MQITVDPWMSEWGNPTLVMWGHPDLSGGERREVKHLSTSRKRNRRDSLSSGERSGKSLNLVACISLQALCAGGCGMYFGGFAGLPWSKKSVI